MLEASYKTKKELKETIGKSLRHRETSAFAPQYKDDGILTVVGPDVFVAREWFASVTMKGGKIAKVE